MMLNTTNWNGHSFYGWAVAGGYVEKLRKKQKRWRGGAHQTNAYKIFRVKMSIQTNKITQQRCMLLY